MSMINITFLLTLNLTADKILSCIKSLIEIIFKKGNDILVKK